MITQIDSSGRQELEQALAALRAALEIIDNSSIPRDIGALVDEAIQRLARLMEIQI
jgi:hypothetical protein